jgi:hypothetical protein
MSFFRLFLVGSNDVGTLKQIADACKAAAPSVAILQALMLDESYAYSACYSFNAKVLQYQETSTFLQPAFSPVSVHSL